MSVENPSADQDPIEKSSDKPRQRTISEPNSSHRIELKVAILGLIGAIIAAIITAVAQPIGTVLVIRATAAAETRAAQTAEYQATLPDQTEPSSTNMPTPTMNIVIAATPAITAGTPAFTETPTPVDTPTWTPDPTVMSTNTATNTDIPPTPTLAVTDTLTPTATATHTPIPSTPTATPTPIAPPTPTATATTTPRLLRLCPVVAQLLAGQYLELCGQGQPGSVIELRKQEHLLGNSVLVNEQGTWSLAVKLESHGSHELEVVQLTNGALTGAVGIAIKVVTPTPTATRTATPKPTRTNTATPTSTATWTATTPSTATATATLAPSPTTPSPTATTANTPMPRPTVAAPVTPTSPPTVATLSVQGSVTLLGPFDAELKGQQTFSWSTNVTLGDDQYFEMVFWPAGADPMTNSSFSPAGASKATEVTVNLDKFAEAKPGLLQHDKVYEWGVLLVELNPYRKLHYLGGGHHFMFKRSGGGGGGGTSPTPPVTTQG